MSKKIAYVPQNHIPPFPFTVEEIVEMGRNPHKDGMGKMNKKDREVIDESLNILKINHLKNSIYTKISGGERQLVLIARAISQETPIMIFDEPVSNLDFGNHARVVEHICNLVSKLGKTVIMTTHHPDHSFLPECNVLLLCKDGKHYIGKGKDVVTEKSIKELYNIDNKVINIYEYKKTVCIALDSNSCDK